MRNRLQYQNRPLSNEEINEIAPSVFASEPWYAQSERYAFVPTVQVIDGMREAGFFPYSVSQARTRVEGKEFFTKHVIRFRPTESNLTKVGDTAVESVMTNSHDGTSQWELGLGAFRLACLNGLMVSEGICEAIRIRHIGNIIDEVISGTHSILAHAPKVVEAIREWKAIDLTSTQARILAEEAHSLRFDEGAVAPSAEKLLQPRRYEDNGTDLWSTFNRIQENVIQGGLRTVAPAHVNEQGNYVAARRNRTRAVTGISENMKLNRALWSLGEKMAQLVKA